MSHKWYWLLLALLAAFLVVYVDKRGLHAHYQAWRASEASVEALRRDLGEAEARVNALEARVEDMNDDPVEQEAAMRRNKNLVREGETVYRVLLPGETP